MARHPGTDNTPVPGTAPCVVTMQVAGGRGPLDARLYRAGPPNIRCDCLIVYFHGGYFIGGDLDDSDTFLRQLAEANPRHAVLATNYTLAQQSPFPAAAEDAYAVLAWAKANKSRLGWSGAHLMVAGVEAGANLAAVSAQISIDRHGPVLAGQILMKPMLDCALSTRSMRESATSGRLAGVAELCAAGYRRYLPNAADRCHPYASPLYSTRLHKLPAVLILSSQDDPLRDEAEQYGMNLIASGVPTTVRRLPGADDVPCSLTPGSAGAMALAEVSGFIAAHVRQPER